MLAKKEGQENVDRVCADFYKRAAILGAIDGAFSIRMLYGTSTEVPIVSPAEAILKSFQNEVVNIADHERS